MGRSGRVQRATGAGRQKQHQQWMAAFADEIEILNPKMVGRIDWDTAQYLKDKGVRSLKKLQREGGLRR